MLDTRPTFICDECGENIPIEESQTHECPGRKAIREEIERIFGKYQEAYKVTILPADKDAIEKGAKKYQ